MTEKEIEMAKKETEKETEEVNENYDYLVSASEEIPYQMETTGQSFIKVSLGGNQDRVDETTGTQINPKQYNASNWPGFNYDNLFVVPLLIQPNRRVMYVAPYDGQQRPPDCWSPNGVENAQPGISILGTTLHYCGQCPFGVYGSTPACRPRPALYGLALFYVGDELKAYPNFFDVATMSRSAVNDLNTAIQKPASLNGNWQPLAPFTRVVKMGKQIKTTGKGPVTGWTMKLLTENDSEADRDGNKMPNFAPKEFISPDFLKAAELANNALIRPVTMIESKGEAPKLSGGTATYSGSVDMGAPIEVGVDTF